VNRGAALTGALLATLATPPIWPLALAAFLIRGGILLVALPILVLPTPVGLGNLTAPALTSIAFGSISAETVLSAVAIVVVVLAWVLAGGWLAAALEAETARIVAVDEGVRVFRSTAPPGAATASAAQGPQRARRVAARILAARLLALLPLAVALAWGSVRIVGVTYRELTNPIDVAVPIVQRVLLASPDVIVAVVLSWMVGEVVGAIAARRIVLGDVGVTAGLGSALTVCVRHPFPTAIRFWVPTLVLLVVLVPSVAAVGAAWAAADAALDGSDPLRVLGSVVLFVGLWLVGLLLTGVVCAWRATVWTIAEVIGEGTFGGSGNRRPGHWRPTPSSAKV
jgi:hypothetical protein